MLHVSDVMKILAGILFVVCGVALVATAEKNGTFFSILLHLMEKMPRVFKLYMQLHGIVQKILISH